MSAGTASARYANRRGELEHYFDRTALDSWTRLTSDAPVSRIRATVRAGRDAMRDTLLDWLPRDLAGQRLLDAGCGTGAAALAAAARGASVVGVDVSPSLIGIARERTSTNIGACAIRFVTGDMLDGSLGEFDHVLAMDSLIHYETADVFSALAALAARTRESIVFTVAPWTPLLAVMHTVGRLLPASERAPDIVPVRPEHLAAALTARLGGDGWRIVDQKRISTGFYKSQGFRLVRG
jgi:magnesium-protoporphyrin O-methyltransferase